MDNPYVMHRLGQLNLNMHINASLLPVTTFRSISFLFVPVLFCHFSLSRILQTLFKYRLVMAVGITVELTRLKENLIMRSLLMNEKKVSHQESKEVLIRIVLYHTGELIPSN